MAQPTSSDVHVDRPLTVISTAYIQSQEHFIADKVFPVIPVEKQTDLYFTYTKNDWFRDEAAARAPGTESAGSGYGLSTAQYSCIPYAMHKDVPWQTRQNADAGIDLDRDATEFVTQRLLLRRERVWAANYFATSKWATDITGVSSSPSGAQVYQWSDYTNSTPTVDIDVGKETILTQTGFEANTLVLGYQVFNKLKRHPTVRDQYKYVNADTITAEMLAKLFELEHVYVAKATYASNNEGETAAYSLVHGKSALLCYSNPKPGLLSPSAGYTFQWTGVSQGAGFQVGIKNFPMQWLEVDRIEGELAFDCKLVGSDLGYFFTTIIA